MRAKRSKFEIYFEILENVSRGRLIMSHISYRVGLNFHQTRRFLDFLVQQDLINKMEDEKGVTYGITDKGRTLLHHYKAIKEELPTQVEGKTA